MSELTREVFTSDTFYSSQKTRAIKVAAVAKRFVSVGLVAVFLSLLLQIPGVSVGDIIPVLMTCASTAPPNGMCTFHGGLTLTGAPSLETAFILQSGKVGIGTSSPLEKLHVVGDVRFECFNRCISGFSGNVVATGVVGGTIAGGGKPGFPNQVTSDFGTVSGGFNNKVNGSATVSGGEGNTASGFATTVGGGQNNSATSFGSTVAGGIGNLAQERGATVGGGTGNKANATVGATVSGGSNNTAAGNFSVVGGGSRNIAGGDFSAVPGGQSNEANGGASFAAGQRAKIAFSHFGSFLFSDASPFDFKSEAANQFAVRSIGGVRFVSAIDGSGNPSAGVQLSPGSGSWSSISDRNAKRNFANVDGRGILAKLANLPITTWNYNSQNPSIRHIGPMAQDFYAAFRVGEDNLHITTVDADGIMMVSIQALYEMNLEKEKMIEHLSQDLKELRQRLEALEKLIPSQITK